MTAPFDLAEADRLLATTRAVRKRLDFERPVEREVILDCIRLSQQAPTGSNQQSWRWLIVTEPETKQALGEWYRKGGGAYLAAARGSFGDETPAQLRRVIDSAAYLAENIERAPVLAIPCIKGRPGDGAPTAIVAAQMGSIFPAVWSFQLALRARGLGSCLTSFHLAFERDAAELLGIPDDVMQVALLPVAYTKGTDFKPADRPPPETIVNWERWGNKRS